MLSRAIIGQRGNLRTLAGINILFLEAVIKRKPLIPETSAHFNRLFETSSIPRATAGELVVHLFVSLV